MSQTFIWFMSDSYQPYQEILAFTLSDFLSNIGGFMGLLAGVSFLSVIEIVFYFFNGNLNRKIRKVQPISQEHSRVNKNHVLIQLMRYSFKYIKTSDMLGMYYTTDQSLGRFGKILWAVLVFLSFTTCWMLIADLSQHAKHSPVVTRIDSKMWTLNDVRKESTFL
jgi:Amiloride-sensitive sodium channel